VHKARGDYGTTHANVPLLSLNSGGSCSDSLRRKSSDDDESITHVCSPPEAVARALNSLKVESGIDRLRVVGNSLKFYIEFNCLDHEHIAQGFKFDSHVRIGSRAPITPFRLFEQIVWSRSVGHEYHELMPEALSVLR
jgi:hypothetical protein